MKRFLRGCALTAALGLLSVLASGCSQSNETFADIKGEPPPAGGPKSQAEASKQLRGNGAALQSQGYPGTRRRR